jgi:hypothetical protein
MSLRALARATRTPAANAPGWALPFYWCAAACILAFGAVIWLVAALCISMRPFYER